MGEDLKKNEEKNKKNDMKYSGFWIRVLATFIDAFVLGVIGSILFGSEVPTIDGGQVNVSFEGWKILIPIIYIIGFWIWISATPGKYICGIQIVEEDGKKLSWKTAILRYVGYIPSSIALMLGFLWVAFDKKKQGWHDKIAGTYVVKR